MVVLRVQQLPLLLIRKKPHLKSPLWPRPPSAKTPASHKSIRAYHGVPLSVDGRLGPRPGAVGGVTGEEEGGGRRPELPGVAASAPPGVTPGLKDCHLGLCPGVMCAKDLPPAFVGSQPSPLSAAPLMEVQPRALCVCVCVCVERGPASLSLSLSTWAGPLSLRPRQLAGTSACVCRAWIGCVSGSIACRARRNLIRCECVNEDLNNGECCMKGKGGWC